MRIESTQSGHWTDDQLIDHLYGLGPNDGHLSNCGECSTRLQTMQARRRQVSADEVVSDSFLAAQRRSIYARLSKPQRWWHEFSMMKVAAAAAMVLVLGGTAAVYENHQRELAESRADAQLAQDVSQMSFESEPQATAPLKGLFVE
jgi:hypothetical protein